MTYLLVSSAIVGWFVLLFYLMWGAVNEKPLAKTVLVLFLTVSIAWFIKSASDLEKARPCAEYETRMMWSAATKTMMPARVCVERAEWIQE